MAKKITVNLEIVTPETADYFSASLACPADHSEAAETANAALAYVADKGRRALGFLTETQLQQQREQLESLADALGGQSEDAAEYDDAPAAELEVTHEEFQWAMANVAHNLRDSGVEKGMRYPLESAVDIVRAELQRMAEDMVGLRGTAEQSAPEPAPAFDDVVDGPAEDKE